MPDSLTMCKSLRDYFINGQTSYFLTGNIIAGELHERKDDSFYPALSEIALYNAQLLSRMEDSNLEQDEVEALQEIDDQVRLILFPKENNNA